MDVTKRLVYHRHIDKLSAFSIMDTGFKPPAIDDKLKPQYAAFLAHQPDPFSAAQMLLPDQIGLASWVAQNWFHDPEVLEERDRIKKKIGESLLPDKTELLEKVWKMVETGFVEDKLKAAKLYAEIRGFITKEAPAVINNNITNKVIYQKDHGTDDEWEKAAEAQQARSLNVATSRH